MPYCEARPVAGHRKALSANRHVAAQTGGPAGYQPAPPVAVAQRPAGQRFFDWLATYRIAEAQQLLRNTNTAYLKIDEIAERVGYNSPSAFHTAFKRITNQTPAQFRDAAQTERS